MGKTVLLVEDNADNQEIYRLILIHHGFAVLQAWDGEGGIMMARRHNPDLILMDLTMPLIDGLEATRLLKADPATRGIPIIALTAHAEHEDRAAAADAGCTSFLAKPVTPNLVAVEVQRVLAMGGAPGPSPGEESASAVSGFTGAIRSITAGLRAGPPTHSRVNGAAVAIDHLGRRLHGQGWVRAHEIAGCLAAAVAALGACHPLPEEERGEAVDAAIRHLDEALAHAGEGVAP